MKFKLISLLVVIFGVSAKMCPDKQSSCPDAATCCQLTTKSYGCCPLKNAVCCDDHIHCCGEGEKCSAHGCVNMNVTRGMTLLSVLQSSLCPGGQKSCPDDSTCCVDQKGKVYGCCLMPNAICCADEQNCCPPNFTCDNEHMKCKSKDGKQHLKMYNALKNLHLVKNVTKPNYGTQKIVDDKKLKSVVCPGGSFQCPDGYTCCQLPDKRWGCCPFSNATCCEDHMHCCPEHMKCDPASMACMQGLQKIKWLKKIPSFSVI